MLYFNQKTWNSTLWANLLLASLLAIWLMDHVTQEYMAALLAFFGCQDGIVAHFSASPSTSMFLELRSQSPAVSFEQRHIMQSQTAQNPIPLCGHTVEWYSSL
jgi:hypothetical protein